MICVFSKFTDSSYVCMRFPSDMITEIFVFADCLSTNDEMLRPSRRYHVAIGSNILYKQLIDGGESAVKGPYLPKHTSKVPARVTRLQGT